MKRWVLGLLGALAATPAPAEPLGWQTYTERPHVKADVRIAYGPSPAQVVDLFLPKGSGPFPVVVLIHGGCYMAQFDGLPQVSPMAADLARRGYAVWNLDYRKLGEAGAGYPGTFVDVADAVDRLRTEAQRYHLDLRRVVALGHSAGGHLALWAASRARLPKTSPLWRADPLRIGAAISLAGIGDLKGQGTVFGGACGQEAIPSVIDAQGRKDPYYDTSPAEMLPLGVRVVMISGDFDHVMPPFTGRDFVLKLRAAGDTAEVISIPDAGHFDVVAPEAPAWKVVTGTLAREFAALK